MALRTALLDATRRAAEVLREIDAQGRIADGYTRIDPVKIAEHAGVAVMFQPLDKLLGAFIRDGRPGIIVNVARPPGLVHMTCAHELGHFFLGHQPTADLQVDYSAAAASNEQEADQFAYSLLAPQWLIVQIMKRKGWTVNSLSDPAVVYQLSLRLGTSYSSTVWTLNRLKLLANGTAQSISNLQPKKLKQQLSGPKTSVEGNADVWLLDESDRDVILEPHANDVFVLELKSNAGAGYTWSVDEIRSEGFLIELPDDNDVRTQPVDAYFGKDPLVGQERPVRFTVSRSESEHITHDAVTSFAMVEHRPWLPPTEDNSRCEFAAEYEHLSAGLDPSERARRLKEARAANA
ncbi:ImmA/IrrE family metallo-endopeptidase [Burkholderia ubonensis]|uniref:ImmA/IrrE family metallo-endopeptidase n=1 Tax=Burkholderia ubonensis TaxID=101571 RepID=UPI0009B4AECF|nr:ImmA/IrrE family metallo-endopeptidase [Burkholderia ubonensis]